MNVLINNNNHKSFIDGNLINVYHFIIDSMRDENITCMNINLVTTYPKIYARKFNNEFLFNFNKVIRNKSNDPNAECIVSDENEQKILELIDINEYTIIIDSDGVFMKKYIQSTSKLIYIHSSKYLNDYDCMYINMYVNCDVNIYDHLYPSKKKNNYDDYIDCNNLDNNEFNLCNLLLKTKKLIIEDKICQDDIDNICEKIAKINKSSLNRECQEIYKIMDKYVYRITSMNIDEPNKNTEDNLIKSILMKGCNLNNNISKKLINVNNTPSIDKQINEFLKEFENVEDIDFDELEEKYDQIIKENDKSLYVSTMTMANWIDELKDKHCIGLNISISVGKHHKGRYDLTINNIPSSIGSTSELFETLKTSDKININSHVIIGDEISGNINGIIPLYIHPLNWKLAKIYLNPVFNLMLHNSLRVNDVNAWKAIYLLLLEIICGMSVKANVSNKFIKTFFSVWITANVLSHENKYLNGINKYVEQNCITDSKFDASIIAGQIISLGYDHRIKKTTIDIVSDTIINFMLNSIINQYRASCVLYFLENLETTSANLTELVDKIINKISPYITRSVCFKLFAVMNDFIVKYYQNVKNFEEKLKEKYGIIDDEMVIKFREIIININYDKEALQFEDLSVKIIENLFGGMISMDNIDRSNSNSIAESLQIELSKIPKKID